MSWLSQSERLLQLNTVLGAEQELYPIHFSGAEYIASPFQFNLSMVSFATAIDAKKIIGTPVSVQLNAGAAPRYFHGLVTRFNAGAIKDGVRYYDALVQPWLSLLNYTSDCRIFHNKNVIEIAQAIFQEFKFSNYSIANINQAKYAKRDYCVQYQETTLNFLHRLFQEEGIVYYFVHEASKHTLVLADSNNAFKNCAENVEFNNGSGKSACLHQWRRQKAFYSGQCQHTDFNFEAPGQSLHTQQTGTAKLLIAQKFGLYHYPGDYADISTGKAVSQQRFEAQELNHDLVSGGGNYPAFTAGAKFTFANAPAAEDEGDYILLEVAHYASDGTYLHGEAGEQNYGNEFMCLPAKVPVRPMTNAVKPVIYGTQTAIVTGPPGEELYTDHYGRVKVQFYWDRQGKKDDTSSCWIRVAQNLAGNGWGMQFMPRIGQEVVVQFLEGDPDRPLIIGSVYNADHLPPYVLLDYQTRSGIKTHSTKGGGANDANELRFEDRISHANKQKSH